MVVEKVLSALSWTALEESKVCAMLALPQGFASEGRWTSLRLGVPLTPRTGEIAAWACAWRDTLSKRATAARRFLLKIISGVKRGS